MSVKAHKLNDDTILKIREDYNKLKAKDIAEKYSCTVSQVYGVKRKFQELGYHLNTKISITEFQKQILLGGILGDGRLKKNGKFNVLYSECHALGEQGYLQWKFEHLGKLTQDTAIYDKNTNNSSNNAKEFSTKTTPSLIPYYLLSKNIDKVIPQLNELGLIIDLLDDGWYQQSSQGRHLGSYCITAFQYTEKQRKLLSKQWMNIAGVDFHNSGIKGVDLSANQSETSKIAKIVLKYFPKNLDIIQKKFGETFKLLNI